MNVAIQEAKKAFAQNEIPVGAVIVKDGIIISFGYNKREQLKNALAHAEIIAINSACEILGDWRLVGCDMYVTLEPCPMCAGAIMQSRISNLYFGSFSIDNGAFGTAINMPLAYKNSSITVYGGIMEEECNSIIEDFFKKLK